MARTRSHSAGKEVWAVARAQHGVVTRGQLLEAGLSPAAIEHRVRRGRLHRLYPAVFVVGRPELTQHGRWMAAVLACGAGAALSHTSAGELLGVIDPRRGPIHVSLPSPVDRRPAGIATHRRDRLAEWVIEHDGIPVTSPSQTLLDLATLLPSRRLEAAVNEADKLDLIDPDSLRAELESRRGARGVARLRGLLDRRSFRLTDSELERRFLRLVRDAGLALPETRRRVNGFVVDFFWPELGLVVETDGLRYHRTPAQQAADRRRDQAHVAAGITALRFTHAQVRFESDAVASTLRRVIGRLARAAA